MNVSAWRQSSGGRTAGISCERSDLSSGAIHSPAHLLRAGIGPAGDLKDMGIPVRHALFGVGQRLMDATHPWRSLLF